MREGLAVVFGLGFVVGVLGYFVVLQFIRLARLKARFEAHMAVHVQLLGTPGAMIDRICKRVDELAQKLEKTGPASN